MNGIMDMCGVLESETFTDQTGFLYSSLVPIYLIPDQEVQQEDGIVDLLGDSNLSLNKNRARRQAWMVGWPGSGMISGNELELSTQLTEQCH